MATNNYATIDALGFVEVQGLAAAIETADAMLKSANVRLLRQLLRDPALTTITVEGSLGACSAAVDAGRAAAQRMDGFVAATVMGRPAHDTADFVLQLAEAGREPFAAPRAKPAAAAAAPTKAQPAAQASSPPSPPAVKAAAAAAPTPSAAPATPAAMATPESTAAASPATAATEPAAPAIDDEQLLAALVGLPGGYSAASLARRVGASTDTVRDRLEALSASGQLVKRGNRYRLAKVDTEGK